MAGLVDFGKTVPGSDFDARLDVLLETKLLVQANSGGGKSWALRRLLEKTFGAVPHVVFDVDGEFTTLREKHAYVIAGAGPAADCRADVRTANLLARRVLEHGFSVVLDISELKPLGRRQYVRAFLESIMEAPRALWRPLLVIVDEAHMFCPEKGQAESAAAVIDLMTRGRKRGFCGVLATQRISKLNKDAAAEANNKLIGRAALDVDMKRAADELGFSTREEQHQLRLLPSGTFFAFGPALSPTVIPVKIGKVETTHPKAGTRGALAAPPAPAKLKAVLEKLADLPKDAEAEEGELERLRREVAEYRRKGAGLEGKPAAADPEALQRASRNGMAAGYRAALDGLMPLLEGLKTLRGALGEQLDATIEDLERHSKGQVKELWSRAAELVRQPASFEAPESVRKGPRTAASASPPAPGSAQGREVPGREQRILDALAWLSRAGLDRPDRIQVALVARQSPRSSSFANNLGALRTAGLVDYPGPNQVALTPAGRGRASSVAGALTSDVLHKELHGMLPGPQGRILAELIRAWPGSLGRGALAEAVEASATSSSFHNNLGALRSLGFIEYLGSSGDRQVAAAEVLFISETQPRRGQ